MPKKLLKKWLPRPEQMKNNPSFRWLHAFFNRPMLWHLNRASVCRAMAVGLFWAWVPLPFQMVFSASFAIFFKANLPLSVALVWITNPLTMPALYYAAYRFGLWLLHMPHQPFHFQLSFTWLWSTMHTVGFPFLLGCLVLGLFSALVGYVSMHYLWRLGVSRDWNKRRAMRRLNKIINTPNKNK